MIAEIIFTTIIVLAVLTVLYTAADWAYYSGYDRAWNVVMDEWAKELAKPRADDDDWDEWMIRVDAYSEMTDALHQETDNIQLNKVLKEWFCGRRRSKRDHKKPPVQSSVEHETVD